MEMPAGYKFLEEYSHDLKEMDMIEVRLKLRVSLKLMREMAEALIQLTYVEERPDPIALDKAKKVIKEFDEWK